MSPAHDPTEVLVVLLGSLAVGKTSLVSRLAGQSIPTIHRHTVGCDVVNATLFIDGQKCRLSIRDTAGQEAYHALVPIYCRDARGGIIVFSVTDESSFEDLPKWIGFLTAISPNAKTVIFGNKTDAVDARVVEYDQARRFCDEAGVLYLEGSAFTGANATSPFEAIGRIIHEPQHAVNEMKVSTSGCNC
jgi:Ras-related protein Rab-6A